MSNIVRLRKFLEMFEEYKKTGKKTIELKTVVMDHLVQYIKESDVKMAVIMSQRHNLIVRLKRAGVTDVEIDKLLNLKGSNYEKN